MKKIKAHSHRRTILVVLLCSFVFLVTVKSYAGQPKTSTVYIAYSGDGNLSVVGGFKKLPWLRRGDFLEITVSPVGNWPKTPVKRTYYYERVHPKCFQYSPQAHREAPFFPDGPKWCTESVVTLNDGIDLSLRFPSCDATETTLSIRRFGKYYVRNPVNDTGYLTLGRHHVELTLHEPPDFHPRWSSFRLLRACILEEKIPSGDILLKIEIGAHRRY